MILGEHFAKDLRGGVCQKGLLRARFVGALRVAPVGPRPCVSFGLFRSMRRCKVGIGWGRDGAGRTLQTLSQRESPEQHAECQGDRCIA